MKGTIRQLCTSALICSILISLIVGDLQAQGISIGDGFHYNSAVFQMHSTAQGLLIPRLTAEEVDAIESPTEGLQIYSLTDDLILYFDGTSWLPEYTSAQRSVYQSYPTAFYWMDLDSFPGPGRDRSMTFTIEDTAYVVAGRGANIGGQTNYLSDGHKYNSTDDAWLTIPSMPGGGRYDGVGFGIGSIGYVGGGESELFATKAKIYSYDTQTGLWDSIAPYPLSSLSQVSLAFVINDTAYVGTESYQEAVQFHKYMASSDTWLPIAPFPGNFRRKAVTFVLNGKGCVGSGDTEQSSDFYCYDPTLDQWDTIAPLPEALSTLYHPHALTVGNAAYVGVDQILYTYSSATNTWTLVDGLSINLGSGSAAFSIKQQGYFTAGIVTQNNSSSYELGLHRFSLNENTFNNNSSDIVEWSYTPRYKTVTGLTASSQGGFLTISTGIKRNQIMDVSVYVLPNGGNKYPAHYKKEPALEFDYWLTPSGGIIVTNTPGNSGSITSKPVEINLTYRNEE